MRRNLDEAKAALALRLEEYNAKRRVKRKVTACFTMVAFAVTVTAAAVPALVVTNDKMLGVTESHRGEHVTADEKYGYLGGDGEDDYTLVPETDSPGVGLSEGSVNSTKGDDQTDIITDGIYFPAYPVAYVDGNGELTFIASYEKGNEITDALRGAEKKDVDWDYDDTVLKFVVFTDSEHFDIYLTFDGNIIYRREYYETKDGEKLLELLGPYCGSNE